MSTNRTNNGMIAITALDEENAVMGEQEAMVLEVKPFDLHGVGYSDVKVAYRDRTMDEARLGPEGVPENLQPGEIVMVTRVANMIVSLRRP